jgi:hypothetical protein
MKISYLRDSLFENSRLEQASLDLCLIPAAIHNWTPIQLNKFT